MQQMRVQMKTPQPKFFELVGGIFMPYVVYDNGVSRPLLNRWPEGIPE